MLRKTINSQKFRFAVVGGTNTALDFGLLIILRYLGLPVIAANIASTTTSFVFSFIANRKYTFRSDSGNIKREVALFSVVTLFGLWVIQTVVIKIMLAILEPTTIAETTQLLVAKIIATVFSLIWNYVLYSRIVFRKKQTRYR